MTDEYPMIIFKCKHQKGYMCICPDLPGCSAWGIKPKQALEQIEIAMKAWIEASSKAGNEIPKASLNPEHWGR